MSKWQTLQILGGTARYELSHLNLHCLQKPFIAVGSEIVKLNVLISEQLNQFAMKRHFLSHQLLFHYISIQ